MAARARGAGGRAQSDVRAQPKVGEPCLATPVKQHVLRLEVTVADVGGVECLEAQDDAREVEARGRGAYWCDWTRYGAALRGPDPKVARGAASGGVTIEGRGGGRRGHPARHFTPAAPPRPRRLHRYRERSPPSM